MPFEADYYGLLKELTLSRVGVMLWPPSRGA